MAAHNLHAWLAEPLLQRPGARLRHMFGGHSVYLDSVLYLVLADGEQPWNGLLFPAERPQHAAILAEFAYLVPHPVLPKWLYLSSEDESFEKRAQTLVARLVALDPRFGVLPKPRKKRSAKKKGAASKPSSEKEPFDPRPPHLR